MTFQKYLGDSKIFEYDKHYRECRQSNKPFIKARTNPSHGNYYVQIDLITCNYEFTKKEQEEIAKLSKNGMNVRNSSNFRNFGIDKEIAWFDGASHEHVDDFCN